MNSILEKIAAHKTIEIEQAKKSMPVSELRSTLSTKTRDFVGALRKKKPAIIAEIKKASPSKGIIRQDFDVTTIAQIYEQHGASCLSVLTDEQFFQGHDKYIRLAKDISSLPILRKDFIIDDYQIYQSRALDADCILLIVAMLDDHQLHDFCQLAIELNMAILVESHTREELERALPLPTPLMGINNRSLHTFKTDLLTSIELAKIIIPDKLVISESGINTRTDIERMQHHGINHFLIGESLMRCEDIGAKMDELLQSIRDDKHG